MGWNKQGKFGIHTGRTLRNHPTRPWCYFTSSNVTRKETHQFAVTKELKFADPLKRRSFDRNRVDTLGINDGGLSLEDGPIVYSMNKHKRWLLPEIAKQDVEQLYWDHVAASEGYCTRTQPCEKARSEEIQVQNLRVTIVERYAGKNIEFRHPDCFGVTSSCPKENPSKPEKKPRKNYAFVGDLKSKSSSKDDVELCYEFLSPFPDNCWPSNRQLGQLNRMNSLTIGKKSAKKGKGRNKRNRRPFVENADEMASNDWHNEVNSNKESATCLGNSVFPLGAYIGDMLSNSNDRVTFPPLNSKKVAPVCSQPLSPPAYGKGDAIYVHEENMDFSHVGTDTSVNKQPVKEVKPLIVDRKLTCSLSLDSISPSNLLKTFGCDYTEDKTSPRKFIIKADLNNGLQNDCKSIEECLFLFEVADSSSCVLETSISISIANDKYAVPHNLSDILQCGLDNFCQVGSLTAKSVVDCLVEQVRSKVVSWQKSISLKKAAPGFAKHPVEFIQDICGQKPEICGVRDAFEYSVGMTVTKENNLHLSNGNNDKQSQLCCGICFTKEDTQLGTDFTSLLECSHNFCNKCWEMYIKSCIDQGQSCITCPYYLCKTILGEPIVWSLTNTELYQRYAKIKYQVAINMNQQLRHCPTADCTHIAYVDFPTSSVSLPVLCKCGRVWCFNCQNDAHWPASCKEAETFRKKCEDHESLKKTYLLPGRISSVQVKRCPFCSHPIEKSRGCQHMLCRCGNGFCWECLSPWNDHNWDKCDESRKELEDVELAFDFGSARFNKYSNIAVKNFIERSAVRRLTKKAKQLTEISIGRETSASERIRKYSGKNLGTCLEQILHFKFLAHMVLENSAVSLAITETKKMLKLLDMRMIRLDFIVQRLNEIFNHPKVLSDERNIDNVKLLIFHGEKLIRNIHSVTQARRDKQIRLLC